MALKTNWIKQISGYDTKAEKRDAYVKVSSVSANKEAASVSVIVYAEVPSTDIPAQIIDEVNYGFKPSVEDGAKNFITQAYEYLKTLPEFDGASDC